jgi:proline iminopeptidase
MIKRLLSIFIYLFLLAGIFLLLYIFYPRKYDVLPYHKVSDMKYWDLSTGSKIGYVHIDAVGPKKDYPIIYLHGGPGGVISEKIIHMLTPFSKQGFDVYAYDQIGSGSSARLEDIEQYTANRHKSDLEEIVRRIGIDRVILLGQSWGSVLATIYVVDNSDLVDKIIMTGPGPIFPMNSNRDKLKAPDSLNIKAPIYSNQDGNKEVYTLRDRCIRWFASVHGKKLTSDQQADDFFTHLNSSLNRSVLYDTSLMKPSSGGGGYYAHIRTMKSLSTIQSTREKMKNINTPILILKGQYDNQKWGYTQEYIELFKNATLKVIPKAGHFIDVEQSDLYYKEISEFLRQETD